MALQTEPVHFFVSNVTHVAARNGFDADGVLPCEDAIMARVAKLFVDCPIGELINSLRSLSEAIRDEICLNIDPVNDD